MAPSLRGEMMAGGLRPGMHVEGCDTKSIGKIRRLFSAEPEEAEPEGADRLSVEAENTDAEELTDLSKLPATANIGTSGIQGAGGAQGASIAPFASPDELEDVTFSPSESKYMEIHHSGFLGIHGDTIYVPFAVIDAISDETVILACSADEAMARYHQPPPEAAEESSTGSA